MIFRFSIWAIALIVLGTGASIEPQVNDASYALGKQFIHGDISEEALFALTKQFDGAAKGDVDAQYSLGEHFMKGTLVDKDRGEAARWFHRAAEQGHAEAQYKLGWLCVDGEGIAKNLDDAIAWYTAAAAQGHGDAQLKLGMLLVGREATEAFRWLRTAADAGNVAAQLRTGALLSRSKPDEAITWYQRADEGAVPKSEGQYRLGCLYAGGLGVEKDIPESIVWLHGAAVTSDGRAQYALGLLYAYEAEPKDYIQAYRWLDVAATTKPYAEAARDAIALKMTEDEIAEARKNKAAILSRTDKAPE